MKINKLFFSLLIIFTVASCTPDESGKKEGINKNTNRQSLGSSAADLLSDSKFTAMNIEIVYVNGYQPTQTALNNFKSFLEERTYKPDGINMSLRSVSSSNKAPFAIDEIVEIENEIRTTFNTGDEISVYIYFADGRNEKDEDDKLILGSAYRNTSIVIYGETVEYLSDKNGSPEKSNIETAVLNHEFGHLFGLVDLGTEPQSDHKDDDNKGHCNISGCLMLASVEFGGGITNVIEGGNVPGLDEHCIRDLQANGGR